MDEQFLGKLSNADALAGDEEEVRDLIRKRLAHLELTEQVDGLGSIIFGKVEEKNTKSVMLCAHMDEVGFLVRSVDSFGLLHLMKVGGVQNYGQSYQHIRVTTRDRKKIPGITYAAYKDNIVDYVFADVGANSQEEVKKIGINIGDMVTFSTNFQKYSAENMYSGKAMDNRLACYILCSLAERLENISLPYNLYFAFTSSEEVGIRGAKTATQLINPDIVYVIDVATASNQLIRDHSNKRQVGKGPMVTLFDRTLSPNRKMANHFRDFALKNHIPLQEDMFNMGGTDGGEAHKVNQGKPTLVTIVPVRYGHSTTSLVSSSDVDLMEELYYRLLKELTEKNIFEFENF